MAGITLFCLLVIIYIINLIVHESGHAIAISLSKGEITRFRIGKKFNILKLKMYLPIGASVLYIEDNLSKGKRIFIALAGSVFSLIVFLLMFTITKSNLMFDSSIIDLFLNPINNLNQIFIYPYLLVTIVDMFNLLPIKNWDGDIIKQILQEKK